MGIIFAFFQTFGKIPSDKLLLIRNVILGDITNVYHKKVLISLDQCHPDLLISIYLN